MQKRTTEFMLSDEGFTQHICSLMLCANDKDIKGGTPEAGALTNTSSTAATTRKEYTPIAEDAELEITPGKVVKTYI
jgi:hypothetical protein